MGFTQGKEYAELEWPIDILIAVVWVAYAVVFFGTLLKRKVSHIYVANWFYGAFNPIAEVRIWRALSTFLRDPAVTQFIKDHDDNRRLELIKAMIADGSAVSATGQTLDDHLGEWA